MRSLSISLALLTSMALSGCVSWPLKGSGGMAEHDIAKRPAVMPNQALSLEHSLYFELELQQRHLDILVLEGATQCFPALVKLAQQHQYRINRELQGGLQEDAATNIVVQRDLLTRLERQLDNARQQHACQLAAQTTEQHKAVNQQIEELLNSDNQFAFNSLELNPKYIGRLAEAAHLLKRKQQYSLKVTGHADAIGEQPYNQKLSLARAEKVARYLQIFGLDAKQIAVTSVGKDQPLIPGKEAHIRLTNRRITIEIITDHESPKETPE